MPMTLDFHVSPDGHVYAFVLGEPSEPVIVYRAPFGDGRRYVSTCNVRQNRPLFIDNEVKNWPSLGYHFIGRLSFPFAKTRDHVKARLDALIVALDALWTGAPIPATAQRDFPANKRVIENAAHYLQQKDLTTVLTDAAPPSRYAF